MDSHYDVTGWVLAGNVRTLMAWLAHYVGYSYDDSDWQVLEMALPATDADTVDGWYDYPLAGSPASTVSLAKNTKRSPGQRPGCRSYGRRAGSQSRHAARRAGRCASCPVAAGSRASSMKKPAKAQTRTNARGYVSVNGPARTSSAFRWARSPNDTEPR